MLPSLKQFTDDNTLFAGQGGMKSLKAVKTLP